MSLDEVFIGISLRDLLTLPDYEDPIYETKESCTSHIATRAIRRMSTFQGSIAYHYEKEVNT